MNFKLRCDCESYFSVLCDDIFHSLLMFLPAPRIDNPCDLRYRRRWRKKRLYTTCFCVDSDDNLAVVTGYKINLYNSKTGGFLRQIGRFEKQPFAVTIDYKNTYYIAIECDLHVLGKCKYALGARIGGGLALRKDHLAIYVACDDSISELATSSGNVIQKMYVTNVPTNIAVLSTSEIVVITRDNTCCVYNNRFEKKYGLFLDSKLHEPQSKLDLLMNKVPSQIAVDANDYVYVCGASTVNIIDLPRFSLVGIVGKEGSRKGRFRHIPQALAILSSGTLVVGADQLHTIQFFK